MRCVNRRRLGTTQDRTANVKAGFGLPHRVRCALVGLGRVGLIRPIGVARSSLTAVRPAARVMIPPAAPHLYAAPRPGGTAHVGAFVTAGILRPARAEPAISPLAGVVAMLRAKLRLSGHDDAIIVLRVLEIALRRDHVARREC